MLPDADYDCGCKVRSGVDPTDGIETSRLYSCGNASDCPNALLYLKTVRALEEAGDATMTRFASSKNEWPIPPEWKPLVKPVIDDEPDIALPPPDHKFSCGCQVVTMQLPDGGFAMNYLACPKGPECVNVLQYVSLAKSRGQDVNVANEIVGTPIRKH